MRVIVMIKGEDVFGDGGTAAARPESAAEPGVSGRVQERVGKLDAVPEDAGGQQIENDARPVWLNAGGPLDTVVSGPQQGLLLPDKPSIVVLPFQNVSDGAEQEYFTDGMVDEIITALSRISWLFVIARNSSFAYKGRPVDAEQVGAELGVRYVLEGSVRKSASRLTITGRLVDAAAATQLWAGAFEGNLENVFAVQYQISESVVGQIAPELERAEIERAKRKPTDRLDAYELFLRGMAHFHQQTRETNSEALRLFYEAIELDPEFALPYGLGGICHSRRKTRGWAADHVQERVEAERLARRAVELGHDDAIPLYTGGFTIAHVLGDLDWGDALIDAALALDPNSAGGWYYGGWVKLMLGKLDAAVEYEARAMRLSPLDPLMGLMQAATGFAYFWGGHYDEAIWWSQKACLAQPNFPVAWRLLAASAALAGRLDEAQKAKARAMKLDAGFRASNLANYATLRRSEDVARYEQGLRLAGLPD